MTYREEEWNSYTRNTSDFDLYLGTTEEDSRIKDIFTNGLTISTGKRTFEYSFGLDDAIAKLRDFCFYLDKYSDRGYPRYSCLIDIPSLEKDELTFLGGLAKYSAEIRAGGTKSKEHFSQLLNHVLEDCELLNPKLQSLNCKFEEYRQSKYIQNPFLTGGIAIPIEICSIRRLLEELNPIKEVFQQIIEGTNRNEIPTIIQIDPRCPTLGLTWLTDYQEFKKRFPHYCYCGDCDISRNRDSDNLGPNAHLFDSPIVLSRKIDPRYIRKVIRPLHITSKGYEWDKRR